MNDLRSMVSSIARRMSALSNGGAVLFTIRLVLLFIGATSQTALVACALMSLSSGMVTA